MNVQDSNHSYLCLVQFLVFVGFCHFITDFALQAYRGVMEPWSRGVCAGHDAKAFSIMHAVIHMKERKKEKVKE